MTDDWEHETLLSLQVQLLALAETVTYLMDLMHAIHRLQTADRRRRGCPRFHNGLAS